MEFEISYIFPVITTILSFLFFASVVEQYRRKKKPHQLVWAVSMFLFFITAGAEATSLFMGYWVPVVYRAYYLFAAIQVSLMGAGLLYLFTSRSVIHERNSAVASIIFGSIWILFSNLFLQSSNIFLLVLIPAVVIVIAAIIYIIINIIDRIRFRDLRVAICSTCREHIDNDQTSCDKCSYGQLISTNPSSAYPRFYQRLFQGHNFSHLFLLFSIYLFLLMNLYVWTLPLNTSVLTTGKEVSGTPWQADPSDNTFGSRAIIRLFSPLHTVPGAIALIGGGIYSYISWQRSIKRNTGKFAPMTGIYNLYIAFGAYVLGLGATASGYGLGTLYISEVISVAFMYFGFLESDHISKDKIKEIFTINLFKRKSVPSQSV